KKEQALRNLHALRKAPLRTDPAHVDAGNVEQRALSPDEAAALGELTTAATLSVPLVVRDRAIGVMTFGAHHRVLGDGERKMATDLARHAALAVDNARLYLSAQQALHARDEFLSIAAHELRTPLTTLQLQIQSLHRRAVQNGDHETA